MKKSDEILIMITHLSTPTHLPDTFSKLDKIVWESFRLGREYELQLQKEVEG